MMFVIAFVEPSAEYLESSNLNARAMFKDRKEAGEKLGRALERYRDQHALVLGIPRGGAETAYYVAKHLNADLSLVITRKLGFPFNPEAAFGAVAEDGSIYISALARQSLSAGQINQVLEQEKQEIRRRIEKLRRGKPLPGIKGRTVIITDDGIATGATLLATIELCKKKKAGKIVVAAPVSGPEMEDLLREKVDDVVILEKPRIFDAVSQGYLNFHNLTDDEALAFLDGWEVEHSHASFEPYHQQTKAKNW